MSDRIGGAEQRQRASKHIFAVNGSSDFLDIVRQLFEEENFNVTTTNFVPQTFDMVAALKPDLIILDLIVSRRGGWDLLEQLHAEAVSRNIPVLVTSTDDRLLDRVKANAERYGGQAFLSKPLDIEALLKAAHDLIGGA